MEFRILGSVGVAEDGVTKDLGGLRERTLLARVAELIARLLRACPALRVLATSRSRLGLVGEAILPGPAARDPEVVAQAEAVRLLRDRAALARPGFALTAQNAPAVSEICRRLDGIPLALELAAARLNALSAGQLAARIDDRFRLLAGGGRGGLPRHRTLRPSNGAMTCSARPSRSASGGWPCSPVAAPWRRPRRSARMTR